MARHRYDAARSASEAVLTSPDHLWSIFAALPAKDLVMACRVCRQWRDVERENEEALWRPLCSRLALRRGAKRQYESSARLNRLSSKRRCRVLHSNLHSHIRQTRSPNAVFANIHWRYATPVPRSQARSNVLTKRARYYNYKYAG